MLDRLRRVGPPALAATAAFLAVHLLAVAVAPTLSAEGVQYGDGGTALLPLAVGLVVGTVLALGVARYGLPSWLLRGLVVVGVAASVWLAVAPPTARLVAGADGPRVVGWIAGGVLAVGAALASRRTRRRWLRNAIAVVATAGAAAVFGASLAPRFAVLGGLAVTGYDAIAVYATGHMRRVAAVGQRLDLPTAFVFGDSSERSQSRDESPSSHPSRSRDESRWRNELPSRDESQSRNESPSRNESQSRDESQSRRAGATEPGRVTLLLGTGDALFPAMIAASVRTHTAVVQVVGGPSPVAAAVGPILGSLVGLFVLQVLVARGGTHAGLPFVVGGAVFGWLLTGGGI